MIDGEIVEVSAFDVDFVAVDMVVLVVVRVVEVMVDVIVLGSECVECAEWSNRHVGGQFR